MHTHTVYHLDALMMVPTMCWQNASSKAVIDSLPKQMFHVHRAVTADSQADPATEVHSQKEWWESPKGSSSVGEHFIVQTGRTTIV